jgi:undecaprenyl-diphosphatase
MSSVYPGALGAANKGNPILFGVAVVASAITAAFALGLFGAVDDAIVRWLNHAVTGQPRLERLVGWLGGAALFKFGPFVICVFALWFQPGPEQQRRRGLLVRSVGAAMLAVAVGRALALFLPFRDRPFARPDLALVMPDGFDAGLRTWSSFPSDHAVVAFSLAVALAYLSRPVGLLLVLHAVALVSVPRVALGVHYPSDIAGGALFGALVTWLVMNSRHIEPLVEPILRFERRKAAWFYAGFFVLLFEITEMFESLRFFARPLFRLAREALA